MTWLKIHKAPLRTKYFFWTTAIILIFCLASSLLYYTLMKRTVTQDALRQSEIMLQEVEAIRDYVKEVIRPAAYALTDEDDFILELMSTTYVSLRIMESFQEKMEDYTYRRVSTNPRNPENRADRHEEEMADWFEEDRSRTFWQGMVNKPKGTYFVSMVPDYITTECLYCHGTPQDAPPQMIEKYGDYNGFRFEEGDLAGISSVSIPVSEPLKRLRNIVAIMFLLVLAASFCLLLVLNLMFDKLVVSRLSRVIAGIGKTAQPTDRQHRRQASADELDTLKESFRHLNRYVSTAQKGSDQLPNFIGAYVIQQPLAAGTLSWIYSGYHADTLESVTLKIPFENIADNPIYRGCYLNEMRMLDTLDHPGLFKIMDTVGNVLIGPGLTGYRLESLNTAMSRSTDSAFFLSLFKLIAYLHTHGVVLHNLRPGVCFCSPDNQPLVFDAGLASHPAGPDELFDSGLGPQGTPTFMAPEQLENRRGDSRSDIYSLGVWLYMHFTGKPIFTDPDSTLSAIIKQKSQRDIIRSSASELPSELVDILMKAMQPNPEDRYQWVEDLRDDITLFLKNDKI